ncbi:MAG: PQQ-binding-like beta-propeller repeat protein [Bacteroidetes bacterium]|nr:PQQ-binding-like beta-propeller repeat protein [Bacteroidota bacterium]
MKTKLFALIVLFTSFSLFASSYKFAWISDLHIGSPNAGADLDSVVNMINKFTDLKFVLATGDISEKGKNTELEEAKNILSKLKMPYFIIPGNHDTKWSESACTKFIEIWGDDKFYFETDGDVFIGLNSGIPLKGGGGHIKPEDLNWLENQVSKLDTLKEIYFVVHHPLNEDIDNWFAASNILRNKNIKLTFNGHGHTNKISEYNGIPAVMCRSTLRNKENFYGFTLVENTDSLISFFEIQNSKKTAEWGKIDKRKKLNIPSVPAPKVNNFSGDIKFSVDLNSTLVALPTYYKGFLFAANISGILSCYDSTGASVWEYDTYGSVVSTPSVIDGYCIVATASGDLITLNAFTGEQIQSIGFDEGITSQLISFDYSGDKILMFPKDSDSKACVVLGTSSGRIYCYDVETLQEYWVFEGAEDMIETKPLRAGNRLVFGSWDSKIYCIDDRNGLLIWKWDQIKNFYYSPAACYPVTDGKRVYITSPNKNVYAIDLALGITAWEKKNYDAWESIGISDDGRILYVKGTEDKFNFVSTITTNWVKVVDIKYGLDTMPGEIIQYKDRVLFNSKNGNVYSIDKNYKAESVMFLGAARVNPIQKVGDNLFIASNMDGRIVLFSL